MLLAAASMFALVVSSPWADAPVARANLSETVDFALNLASSNQKGTATDSGTVYDGIGGFSFAAWIRPDSVCTTAGRACMIVNKEMSWEVAVREGVLDFAIMGASTEWQWQAVRTSTATMPRVPTGMWSHIAMAVDRAGNDIYLFINGRLAYSLLNNATSVPTTGRDSTEVLTIGGRANGGDEFAGAIDEVRLYNTARKTEAEAQADMGTWGPTSTANLAAYFDFNEASGTTMNNKSTAAGAGPSLTLNGSPTRFDVKTVDTTTVQNETIVTFPRTYLTSVGGYTLPSGPTRARVLLVGGGGGGGSDNAGGGGAGGVYDTSWSATPTIAVSPGVYPITVGQGGFGGRDATTPSTEQTGVSGWPTSAFGLTAGRGGVGGSGHSNAASNPGGAGGTGTAGGSGGGGSSETAGAGGAAGAGTIVNGFAGGTGLSSDVVGGGGGGASAAGAAGGTGTGGAGKSSGISGTVTFYGGGGGGGRANGATAVMPGGTGGGGNGAGTQGGDGTANTGGGGGGAAWNATVSRGGFGGTGVVVLRWANPVAAGGTQHSLSFDASGTSMATITDTTNSTFDLTQELTFEAWINPSTKNGSVRNLIAKENSYLIALFASNDQWNPNRVCFAFRGAAWSWQCSTTAITTSGWTHLAVARTGTQVSVYLNGVLSTVTTLDSSNSGTIATNNNPIGIGNRPASMGESFLGNIDEIRLWNYSRSAEEIAKNYQRRLAANVLHMPVDNADAAFSTVTGTNTVLNRAARSGGGFNAVLGSGAALTSSSAATADLNITGGALRGFLPGVDTASSNASLRYSISTQGTKGTATVNPTTGEYSYVPNISATGSDSFTYTLTGANGTTTSTLSITLPDAGIVSSQSFTQAADITATVGTASSLGYASPVTSFTNGETVRATLASTSGNLAVTLNGTTVSGGAQNTTSLSIDGTQAQVNAALNSATITSSTVTPARVTLTVAMAPVNQSIGGRTWTYNSNGHWYSVLDSGSSFTQTTALTNARTITVGGRRAFLATIQSAGENSTVTALVPANSAAWIGGDDSVTEGTFRWNGNDAYGAMFSGGTAFRNRYSGYPASGEPNDHQGNEDWMEIGNNGVWNDCGPSCSRRYAIMEVDPVSTRTVTNIDFARSLTATFGTARNLQLGSAFLNTSAWGTGETVTATFTASAGTIAYTQGTTTVTAGASGSSTVTFEGGRDAMNTALNTVTVTPPAVGSSTVTMSFGVKRQTSGSYVYLPATDHFYFRNATTALRSTHVTTAASTGFGGTTGYLVTVTSGEEHATVKWMSSTSAFSGATDSVSEGQFAWDSPDAYEIISDYDQPLPGAYTSFHPAWVDNSGEALVVTFQGGEYWDDQPTATNSLTAVYEWAPIDTLVTFNVTTTGAVGFTAPTSGLTATLGSAYSLGLSPGVTGGLSPFTYSVSGSLPSGLTLNASTGVISGTTTVAGGSFPITATVTDANGATATTSSFSIRAGAPACSPTTTVVGTQTVVQFTATTACEWAVPSGVTSIDAFLVGGGGGGGGDGGTGGGGGATTRIDGRTVATGDILTVQVGTSGSAGAWGLAGGAGGASSLTPLSGAAMTANGGSGGASGPATTGGAGGTSTNGYAGGAGGTAAPWTDGGGGGIGATGSINFFTGSGLEYGGGGGGGILNGGTFTVAARAGQSGGGNGCSANGATNTAGQPGLANRGGGGGAGCAGNGGRTNGGAGGTGAVIIRYATDPLDAFPSDIGSVRAWVQGDSFQGLDSARRSWLDVSGNGRSATTFRGTPTVTSVTGNGASGTVRTLSGDAAAGLRFPSGFLSSAATTANDYTFFHVARYSGGTRGRIFDATNSNWLSGFWSGNAGWAFHNKAVVPANHPAAWVGNVNNHANWVLSTDQNNSYRSNGGDVLSGSVTGATRSDDLTVNHGQYAATEQSEWNVAEVLVFSRELTAAEIRRVESYLARKHGLRGVVTDGSRTDPMTVRSLVLSKVGSVSTGNTDRLAATWSLPMDTAGVTGFRVDYKESSASSWTTWTTTGSAATTSTITGLTPGTSYDVRVTPVDAGAPNRPGATATGVAPWVTSSVTLGTLPTSPRAGTAYNITATVTSGATGTVHFKNGGTSISGCTAVTVSSGTATCPWTPATNGSASITAEYSGDSSYLASSTVSASSVTVSNALCSTSNSTAGRFVVMRITATGTCDLSALSSGVESVDVLVVGGGGGGGANVGSGGAGGGGYYRERLAMTSTDSATVTVGAGGAGGQQLADSNVLSALRDGTNGGNSLFALGATTFTGVGGTGGQTYYDNNNCDVGPTRNTTVISGVTGTGSGGTPLTSGNGALGSPTNGTAGAAGGNGFSNSVTGSTVPYGGGGGGGGWNSAGGSGGTGGGGGGANNGAGTPGTASTGGGGGGGSAGCRAGGAGGSGIVIIRHATVPTISGQPVSISRSTSQSATLSVTASASGASASDLTYQWRKNGTDIAGATSSSLVINSTVLADAGTYSVVVRNSGTAGAVSSVTSADAVLTMSQGSQTITFGAITDKTYGDAPFAITATASSGLPVSFTSADTSVCTVAGSTVTLVSTGTCTVTASQAGNTDWLAATDSQRSFTVQAKTLTISGMTAANKTYDRTVTATPAFGSASLVGVVGSDSVTIVSSGATAAFSTASVGTGIIVTASGVTLGGTNAGRYSLTQPTTTANITARTLSVTGAAASARTYDATTIATNQLVLTNAQLSGIISGDTVTLVRTGATATFDTKNIGTGKTVQVAGLTLGGAQASNYAVTQPTVTADITAKTLTVSGITAASKTYDASTAATLNVSSAAFVGVETGDDVTIGTGSATGTFDTKNIGSGKTVQIAGIAKTGTDAGNYVITQPTTTASITAKTLTVSGITAASKTYDASTAAVLSLASAGFVGVESGDQVTIGTGSATGTFIDKNIGTGKTVQVAGIAKTGTDAGNYVITQPTATANITAKTLTVSGITAANKNYDGLTTATLNVSGAAFVGIETGDDVTIGTGSATGTFASAAVGSWNVQVAGVAKSGTDAGNYVITQPVATASIGQRTLTVTGVTATSRTYDGSRTAVASIATAQIVGAQNGDSLTLVDTSMSALFDTKNVGTGKTVQISGLTVTGTNASNYALTQPTTTASIAAKILTVSGITAASKTYDASTTATLSLGSAAFVGIETGDDVAIGTGSATGTFNDKNVGTGKTVQVAGVAKSGTDAGNYVITQPTTTASITAKTLTVSGITATSKTYDASRTASMDTTNAAFVGIETGDDVTIGTGSATGTFDTKNIGTGKTVQVAGVTKSGTDAGNYVITQPTTTASITAKTLTVSGITAANKTYDAGTAATLNVSGAAFVGVETGDDVTIGTGSVTGSFVSAGIGTRTVQVSGVSKSGTDAGNYFITQPTTSATIAIRVLTVTGVTAADKTYDATTTATADASAAQIVGAQGADVLTLVTSAMSAAFDTKNVGTGKTVQVSGLTVSGTNAANYTVTQPVTTAGITAKNLTVTGITAGSRIYDATTSATALLSLGAAALSGKESGDQVNLSVAGATGTFASKDIGAGKTIQVGGLTLSGTDAGNYSLIQPTVSGSISAKALTVSGITAANKTYDAATTATLSLGSAEFVGVESGDQVTIGTGSATGTFDTKNVGTGKTVQVSGVTKTGTDAGNYSIIQPTTTANVTPRPLSVSGITAATKIFDGNTTATLNVSSAAISGAAQGDSVQLVTSSASGTFADSVVGANKTVQVSGLTLSGSDAGNYQLTQPTATADILTASAGLAWSNPAQITYGTVLGASQLNATTAVSGTFTYSPPAGTRLTKGTHTLSVSFVPDNNAYDPASTTVTIVVAAKALTVTGITAGARIYDSTTAATDLLSLGSTTLSGTVSGDNVTLSVSGATGTFDTKNIGAGKTIQVAGLSISGTDAGNYALSQPTTTGSISAKALTVTGITAANKTYDAGRTASVDPTNAAFIGVETGDQVTIGTGSATGLFDTKNIGTGKTVQVAGVAKTGTDAGNYVITQPTATANITAKTLTVSGITAANKTYDAGRTASVDTTNAAFVGVETGDDVTIGTGSVTGLFDTKNIGTGKTVQVAGVAKTGTDAGNYVITQPTTTANITAKTLTVSGITAANKTYDGLTTATLNVSGAAFVGVETGDDVTIGTGSATGTFASADVASAIQVQVSGVSKSGTDAGNYVITQPTATANITQASAGLSWAAPSAITFGTSLGGTQQNATASVSGTHSYSPGAGTRLDAGTHVLSVTFTPSSPNYATATSTVQIQVNPKPLMITSNDVTTVFGSGISASFGTSALSGADTVSAVTHTYAGTGSTSYASSTAAPVTAGTYSITPSAVVMGSGLASNYAITYVAGTVTINRAQQQTLVATAGSTTLTYSAPTKATTTLGTTGGDGDGAVSFAVVGGSNAVCSISGTTLTVEAAGTCQVTATKAQGTNHLAATSAPISFTLNQASQSVTLASVADRTYGDADFSVTASSSSGLTVTLQVGPASVCDNPSGHTVRILSVGTCTVEATQSGNGNYLAAATQSRSFQVSPKNLTITGFSADNRVYDGSASATALVAPHLGGASLNGVVSRASTPDTVSLDASAMSAVFADKSVGTAKTITVSGITLSGAHAHRYTVTQPTGLTASVSRRTVTVSGVGVVTRKYDSTTVASLDTSTAVLAGVLGSDTVSLDASAPNADFADANASANQKTVTAPGLGLSGADSGNYQLVLPVLLGTINKADATVIFAATRTTVYDGTPRALASTTAPPSLNVITKYAGSGSTAYAETVTPPTNAGTYSVTGAINEVNYAGASAAAWTVNKQSTAVTIDPTHLSRVFDGTARTPAATTTPSGKNVTISFTGTGGTTYSSSWAPANAGTYTVTVTVQEGNFEGSRSETMTIARAAQSPIEIVSTGTVAYGSTLRLTASGGSGSGAVSYSVASGPCTVDATSGVLTPTGTGTCTVAASREASQNYTATTSPARTVTVTKGAQTVGFTTEMPSLPVTGGTYAPSAVSSVGLPVVVTVTSGSGTVCSLAGGTVTFLAGGTCTISASQAGSSLWESAPTVDQTIEIGKMSQAITFPQPAQLGHGGQPAVLAATASSGLPVTYAVTAGSSSCTVTADGMVVPTAIGTCTVTASQAGDQVHSAAAPVSRTVTVSASLPGAPHISSISAGDSAITVGYSAPFSDGGSTILSYKVTAVSSGAPTVSRSDCSASTMSCTLVGLTNGQSYTVTASAVTVAGVGDASQTVEVLVPAPTVDAPVSVVGTRASTTLDIRWSDAPAFDPATFQQYDVYVRPVGGTYGSPIAVVNSVDGQPTGVAAHRTGPVVHISSVTTRFAQATNLDPAVMYQVKIVTVTSQHATESTANTAAALVMPLANPGPPRDLSIEGSSAGTAVVSWRPPASQGGTPVTSYTVTSSRGACVMSAATSTRCTVTGLSSGDSLTVSVTADNTVGSSAAVTASYSVPAAPGAPGISSVATEQTTATFAWTAPASTGGRAVTSYTAVVSANGAEAARCSTTRTTCTVRGLRAGTAYSFSVRAHNSVGAGAWSQPFVASTTTPPVAPAPATAPAAAPAAVAVTQALPPAPARVRTTSAGSTRTRISASRGTAGVSIPITHAIISVSTRSGRLLARIKVKVDSASPETSVTVPFTSSKVKVAVQFANDYGISAGGPVGVNIAEARTFDTTLVAGQVRVVGTETSPYAYFSRGSSALTPAGKAALRQAAAAVKARGGLVYVSGFAASTEVPSVWLVQSLARKRAEVSAKYLSALGVRQWIYFGGTVAPRSPWDESRVRRVVVSTDTVRHNA